jgi:hypothetical protein
MTNYRDVELHPITRADIESVASFLHENLNRRLSTADWSAAAVPPWQVDAPNHGFMLTTRGEVVGANLAFYANRMLRGSLAQFCNLGALCVQQNFRWHTLRLIRALIKQPDYHFTDLSPSGNLVELNRRMKFRLLDTATALTVNQPCRPSRRRIHITEDHGKIENVLSGHDLQIFCDHKQALAARHLVVTCGSESCYIIYRRERRRNLPLFASLLYIGNREVFASNAPQVFSHLLLHHGIPATLTELRVAGIRPARSQMLSNPRPKMYLSADATPEEIDYLYSELACVAW